MNNRFQALLLIVKRKPLIVALGIVVIAMTVALAYMQPTSTVSPNASIRPTPSISSSNSTDSPLSATIRRAPSVKFNTYENKAVLPNVSNPIKQYTFKTGFSDDEVRTLASKFNLTTVEPAEGLYKVVSNLQDSQSRGVLAFNTQNGMWTFQSFGNHLLPGEGLNLQERVQQYLTSIGAIDSTVECPFYYEKNAGGTVQQNVECHRSWGLAGLPIFNTVGVINISESRRLSDLQLGGAGEITPPDPSIINASDGTSGRSRSNDFNTLTVSLVGNRITSIASTIRPIQITDSIVPTDLLTPVEALAQFTAQKAQFSLTIPAGSGSTSLDQIYPNNQANAQTAIITDFVLTYLENPVDVPQKAMVPMYLVKGTSQLSSGYTVRFHQILPAMRSGLSSFPSQTRVAGLSTSALAQGNSLKFGTFDPTLTTAQLPPVNPTSPATQPPQTSSECIPISQGSNMQVQEYTILVPGMGEMIITRPTGTTNTFYFKSATFEINSISRIRDIMQVDLAVQQFEINFARSLASNASLLSTTTPTTDDIYAAYAQINVPGLRNVCGSGTMYKAPLSPECIEASNPNRERIIRAITLATQNIKASLQSGSLSAKSAQPDIFPNPIPENMGFLYIVPSLQGEDNEIRDATDSNACYISGVSPVLYIYPDVAQTVRIAIPHSTYTDPVAVHNSWNVYAQPNGALTIDGVFRDRLYYEYDPSLVSLSSLPGGYSIDHDRVESFIRTTIAPQLNLRETEANDMVLETKRVLSTIDTPFVTLRLAESESLNKEFPLSISTQPSALYRIHLLISGTTSRENFQAPSLTPVSRTGFTVVEIGARAL